MTRDEKYTKFVEEDTKNNKGRLVNSCDELRYLLANPDANEIFRKKYLNEILTYATQFSEFYQGYSNFSGLQDFPIISKQTMKEHWDEIVVSEYANADDSCIKYTSGSTGTPFQMVMDRYKHCRWIAGNKIFRENVGVRSHEKTVFISETVQDKKISMERQDRDNVYYLDCKYLDDGTVNRLIDYLVENNVRTMTSLASVLDRIAYSVMEGKAPEWRGDFLAVFSVSEPLKESTRKIISEYFDCPVYVYYANEENGALATEDGSGNGLRANNVDYYLEVLQMDNDEPAKDGEIGRLVITDFFNKAFPIIRYENGDLVAKKTLEDGRVYLTKVAGRKADTLYDTQGRMVHYFNGISFLEPLMDIKQFQLIQYSYTEFTWVLNTENHSYEDFILEECKNVFGQDAHFKFEYVDEIPKLRSGKSRMTVCLIPEKLQ